MTHEPSVARQDLAAYRRPQPAQAAADAIPLLVDGSYHLFHLVTPPDTVHHPPRLRSSWSRLRSKDLLHWARDQVPVISPGNENTDPDTSGSWTGCAVLGPDGRMNIFYTGYSLPQNGMQVVLRITATDKHGSHFESTRQQIKIKGAVRNHISKFEDIDFRDPYIFFNEAEGVYWMLVATRLRDGHYWTRGCIALLTSPDLEEWTPEDDPLYAPDDMFCPECPELFTLPNGKWYLVYSRFHAPNSGTVYRIADSPRGPFRTPRDGSFGRIDGRRWYAAKSCAKAGDPARRVYFGWVADRCPDDGKWLWGGDLGVPREVFADANGFLRVEPARAILPQFHETTTRLQVSGIGTTSTVFPDELSQIAYHAETTIQLQIHSCDAISFGLLFDADHELKGHRLKFIPTGHVWSVVLLTDLVPLDDFWADQYNLHFPRPVDGPETLRHDQVVIDGPITLLLAGPVLEVFVGGRSISFRLHETSVDTGVHSPAASESGGSVVSGRIGVFVEDGAIEIEMFTLGAHEMQ